jgi:putative tricarboxylic transport membrane protein
MLNRLQRAAPYIVLQICVMYFYYQSTQLDFVAPAGRIGPDAWPKMILLLMSAACVYEIVKNLLLSKSFSAAGLLEKLIANADDGTGSAKQPNYTLRLWAGICLTIVYILTIDILGFFIASSSYLALFMVVGRYYRWRVIASTSVLGSLVIMFIFMKIVYVSLPLGTGPFLALSTALLSVMGVH